jgi:hypothetical protein
MDQYKRGFLLAQKIFKNFIETEGRSIKAHYILSQIENSDEYIEFRKIAQQQGEYINPILSKMRNE